VYDVARMKTVRTCFACFTAALAVCSCREPAAAPVAPAMTSERTPPDGAPPARSETTAALPQAVHERHRLRERRAVQEFKHLDENGPLGPSLGFGCLRFD
jgi:hypothetical protein